MMCLSGCKSTESVTNYHIPPCQKVDELEDGSTYLDLVEKYLELKDLYHICSEKVDKHNGKLEN